MIDLKFQFSSAITTWSFGESFWLYVKDDLYKILFPACIMFVLPMSLGPISAVSLSEGDKLTSLHERYVFIRKLVSVTVSSGIKLLAMLGRRPLDRRCIGQSAYSLLTEIHRDVLGGGPNCRSPVTDIGTRDRASGFTSERSGAFSRWDINLITHVASHFYLVM